MSESGPWLSRPSSCSSSPPTRPTAASSASCCRRRLRRRALGRRASRSALAARRRAPARRRPARRARSRDEPTVRALLEEDPRRAGDPARRPQRRRGDPRRARGRRGRPPAQGRLDADTLERAVRYAADHRRSVERLQHGALHDALTGLPNRTLFLDRLEQSLRRARRRGAGVRRRGAVPRPRPLQGRQRLARPPGRRRAAAGRRAAARRGAAPRRHRRAHGRRRVHRAARGRHRRRARRPSSPSACSPRSPTRSTSPGRELFVAGSIGIALGGPDVDPEELIRDADVAMYRAKAQGKARHAVFDAQMHRHVLARLDLETDLRQAIEAGSLQVLYQPIVRTATREVTRVRGAVPLGGRAARLRRRSPRRPG